jgi:hypothetical protein
MKTKENKFLGILVMALALVALVAPAQAADWDSTRVYTGPVQTYDLAVGSKLKGASDDTVRIFTTQYHSPYQVLLFTDRSTALPMNWATDIIFTDTSGNIGVAIGDPDRNGQNELLFGRYDVPYRLRMSKWNGSAWITSAIATLPYPIWDIAVGDANNDGNDDDIIAATAAAVFRIRWNGASWDTTRILNSGLGTYGVAIGNFDAAYAGNEIVAVTMMSKAFRIRWTGAAWDTLTIYYNSSPSVYDVTVGDFDASNPGDEIALSSSHYSSSTHGAVIELYGSGTSWSSRDLYSPTDWGTFAEIAAGDFYAGNAGAEIAAISGSGDSNQVRLIYGSGTSWNNEKVMGTGGMYNYGVAIGNVNRYRPGDELAAGGNRNIWEVQESAVIANNMQTLSIDNPAAGCTLIGNSSITIRATVMNAATNTQSNVPVNLTISDGVSYTYTDAETTGTLVQGQTQQMIFAPDWTVPNSFASYTIKVKTALTGDEYPADDSLFITVTGVPSGYTTESFEGTFPPADWTLQSTGTYTAPWTKSLAHAHTGTYSARGYYSSSGYTNEWLITPRLDLSVKSGGILQFWKRFYAGSASYPDTLEILMSEDGGSTWPMQIALWTPDSTSDANFVLQTFSLFSSSNNVKIAFRYASNYGDVSFIDDVILPPIYVPPVKCGDVNDNGTVDLGDVVYFITYQYKNGPAPVPYQCVGDVTSNDVVDLGDVVYLITYQYKNGPAPDPDCCNPPWGCK